MKKMYLICFGFLTLSASTLFAQWDDSQSGKITTADDVGIGTSSPSSPLEIIGDGTSLEVLKINSNYSTSTLITTFNNTWYYNSSLQLNKARGSFGNPADVMSGDNIGGVYASIYRNGDYRSTSAIQFRSGYVTNNSYGGYITFETTTDSTTNRVERMRITNDGNVAIGTTTTGTHKLAVDGSIGAREIIVESGAWSDFVFKEKYPLMDLNDVENYIIENGHLPDIPKESSIKKEGINLGKMDAKLLQKIEELTLYIIQINKEVNELKNYNKKLENKLTGR